MQSESLLCALFLFAGLAGIIVVLFLVYQLHMIFSGFTSNHVVSLESLIYD